MRDSSRRAGLVTLEVVDRPLGLLRPVIPLVCGSPNGHEGGPFGRIDMRVVVPLTGRGTVGETSSATLVEEAVAGRRRRFQTTNP